MPPESCKNRGRMCGIIGGIVQCNSIPILIEGHERMGDHGYDAGDNRGVVGVLI